MKLYRGQKYGEAVGQWWTSTQEDAENFAMARAAHGWVVLMIEIDARKLRAHLFDQHVVRTTYKLPRKVLRQHVMAVRVVAGHITLDSPPEME